MFERSILNDMFACRHMGINMMVDGRLRWMLLLTEVSGASDRPIVDKIWLYEMVPDEIRRRGDVKEFRLLVRPMSQQEPGF